MTSDWILLPLTQIRLDPLLHHDMQPSPCWMKVFSSMLLYKLMSLWSRMLGIQSKSQASHRDTPCVPVSIFPSCFLGLEEAVWIVLGIASQAANTNSALCTGSPLFVRETQLNDGIWQVHCSLEVHCSSCDNWFVFSRRQSDDVQWSVQKQVELSVDFHRVTGWIYKDAIWFPRPSVFWCVVFIKSRYDSVLSVGHTNFPQGRSVSKESSAVFYLKLLCIFQCTEYPLCHML